MGQRQQIVMKKKLSQLSRPTSRSSRTSNATSCRQDIAYSRYLLLKVRLLTASTAQ